MGTPTSKPSLPASAQRSGILIASKLAAFPMHISLDGFRAFTDEMATILNAGVSLSFEDFFRPRPAMSLNKSGIATISVCGVLAPSMPGIFQKTGNTDYNVLCAELAQAASNPSVRGIMLLVNSPGGSTSGHDEAHHAVLNVAKSKPVAAFVGEQACSAAYGIACAATVINAAGSSITGNIGSILTRIDFSQMYTEAGVRCEVYASDPIKATFASDALASTKEQADFVQAFVQKSADRFKANVSAQRPRIAAEDMRGQWYWGSDAAAHGFIDCVSTQEKAYADLLSICGA